MIAVDTNVLVYAHRADAPQHEVARRRIASLAAGLGAWAIPWPCVHEFLNIVTHPRIYDPPTPLDLALDQVAAWLEAPTLQLLAEAPGHWARLSQLARRAALRGPQVHDARIAAICLEHGVRELWTADRDFGRFPDVATTNPLIGLP
jgi:toxin-antitoxin system PIN domain toxin